MKKVILILIAFLIITSCDEINRPYLEDGPDTVATISKKVLLTDFTAIYCVFCPRANDKSASLEDLYGKENLIVMGVHVTALAAPRKEKEPDLRTPVGDELFAEFASPSTGLPIGMVNRVGDRNNKLLPNGSWDAPVQNQFNQEADIEMNIETDYDDASRELNVTVNSKYLKESNTGDYISVYITEDSIVTTQKDVAQTYDDYVHQHVFRGSMNGTFGDKISDLPIPADSTVTREFEMDIPEEWRAEKLRVIAFIHDNEGEGEVRQVEAKYLYGKEE